MASAGFEKRVGGLDSKRQSEPHLEENISQVAEQVIFQSLVSVFRQRLRQKGVACN